MYKNLPVPSKCILFPRLPRFSDAFFDYFWAALPEMLYVFLNGIDHFANLQLSFSSIFFFWEK